jgi:cytochrome P450
MRMLLDHPELMACVRDDPERTADLVEESLRLEAPVQMMLRLATRDTELGGTPIPKGALLMLAFGSANHDESVFPDPETPDIDRANLRKHLTFSTGPHHCLGSALARAEVRIGINVLLSRAGDFELEPGSWKLEPSPVLRGPERMALSFRPVPCARGA